MWRQLSIIACCLLAIVSTQIQTAAQPVTSAVIVRFYADAPFASMPPGRADARARANAAAWSYLDRGVLGAVQLLERQHGFEAGQVYSAAIRGFAARLTPGQIEALQHDPLVQSIEPDTEVHLMAQTLPWNIDRVDADISSTHAGDGTGAVTSVNTYIIDAGVGVHPDLNLVAGVDFTGAGVTPSCAHGTRVGGVLAARDNDFGVVGVLPAAPITSVRVVSCDPIVSFASWAIKGVDWVRANAVKPAVANISIGGFINSTLDAAVANLAASGVFVSVAAGNSSTPACWTSPQRAGTAAGVMTVAATTETNREASWSSFGSCVDIWAPGTNILTTDLGGGYATSNGTSYSAPHVAGTAGLYLASHPTATAAQVESALRASAKFTGTFSKDFRFVKLVWAGGY